MSDKLADALRARMAEKRAEYEDYKRHLGFRMREEDLHGCWDASVNMSEVSNYLDALEWALGLLT